LTFGPDCDDDATENESVQAGAVIKLQPVPRTTKEDTVDAEDDVCSNFSFCDTSIKAENDAVTTDKPAAPETPKQQRPRKREVKTNAKEAHRI
jgi:hypothetical protein